MMLKGTLIFMNINMFIMSFQYIMPYNYKNTWKQKNFGEN